MQGSRLARNVRAALALGTLSAFLAGCTSWQPLETPYEKALSERSPDRVEVTLVEGTTRRLYEPAAYADSLVGFTSKVPLTGRVAIPVSDIRWVQMPHANELATALLVGGVIVTGLAAFVVISFKNAFDSGT